MPAIADAFPELYRAMLGPSVLREVPAEAKATCASCAMLADAPGAVTPVDGTSRFFRADTKCCTFHPRLPNYLVGAILGGGGEGARRVEQRIASGVGVAPAWLHPPPTYSLLYEHARGGFGKARELRCPYYDDGACSIWAHRDAVCSTWYCKYVAGEDGRRFWAVAKELLSLVEIQLSRRALLEIFPEALDGAGASRAAAAALSPEEIDGAPRADHAQTWGSWSGRERELYLACDELVRGISAAELEAILGLDGTILRRALARAADAICSTELPATLKLDAGATVQWLPDGTVALGAYSGHEAVALPGAAYPLLVRFTGEATVADVRRRLREELSADLADEVLLELYRQRVLVVPGAR